MSSETKRGADCVRAPALRRMSTWSRVQDGFFQYTSAVVLPQHLVEMSLRLSVLFFEGLSKQGAHSFSSRRCVLTARTRTFHTATYSLWASFLQRVGWALVSVVRSLFVNNSM